jgi:Tfp pilus assembly PilM family ATPase
MTRRASLALGVDIGSARTRVALVERDAAGRPRLVAVAARATGDDASGAIGAARAELGTRERRCVLGLGSADTLIRAAAFPAMRGSERRRAAHFEAARFVPYPLDEAAVRVVSTGDRCAIGVARKTALQARLNAAKGAGLRPIAVDDVAFALLRAFADADAIVDIGATATALVVADDPLPVTRSVGIGGRAFTAAVVASLGIDEALAEARKRSVGLAGAGEYARAALVEQIASALIEHRASGRSPMRGIALTGNGARLSGLAEALERALGLPVRLAALPADASDALPADVVRAASPDWGLAYGLALWETAA